jgi:hypothetical protein
MAAVDAQHALEMATIQDPAPGEAHGVVEALAAVDLEVGEDEPVAYSARAARASRRWSRSPVAHPVVSRQRADPQAPAGSLSCALAGAFAASESGKTR